METAVGCRELDTRGLLTQFGKRTEAVGLCWQPATSKPKAVSWPISQVPFMVGY